MSNLDLLTIGMILDIRTEKDREDASKKHSLLKCFVRVAAFLLKSVNDFMPAWTQTS